MAENSAISWCNHTFNPWVGCQKVSPACDHCYAQNLMQHRFGRVIFGEVGSGDQGTRDRTSESAWKEPLKWNREAAAKRLRRAVGMRGSEVVWEYAAKGSVLDGWEKSPPTFVFCASLADVFDNHPDVAAWRRDLFELIRQTRHLTWLLLTKRPQNIVKAFSATISLEQYYEEGPPEVHWPSNILLGTSIEDKKRLHLNANALRKAAYELGATGTFWSCEPLLEDLGDVSQWLTEQYDTPDFNTLPALSWLITGGESGRHARPSDPAWFRSLRDQCAAAGVPFHFKQWGEWQPVVGAPPNALGRNFPGSFVQRLGKKADPGTLDGVLHDARPL